MRFITAVTAAILAAAAAAPAIATPIINPLHPAPSNFQDKIKINPILYARDSNELEARGFIQDTITKWLDKHVHLHRSILPPVKPWGPRPGDGTFHILPYFPPKVVAREEFHTQVMPHGWTPPKSNPYQSPPFVRPGAIPKPGTFHTLPYYPNKAVARSVIPEGTQTQAVPQKDRPVQWQSRPNWNWSPPPIFYQSPPFVRPGSLPQRREDVHTEVMPQGSQNKKPSHQSPPFVPPKAVPRPPYGSGVRPGRPLGPGVRPLTN